MSEEVNEDEEINASQEEVEEEVEFQDTWTKSEAKEWLQDHDFKSSGTVAGESLPIDTGNYWAFRQEDPDKYDSMRTDKSPFDFDEGDGVIAIYGIYDEDDKGSEIQSIRFYHGGDEEEENEEKMIKCPNCDNKMRMDSDTCSSCGADLSKIFEGRCPSCGAYLSDPEVGDCPNCENEVDPFEAINPTRLEEKCDAEFKVVKHWKEGELSKDEPVNMHFDIFFDDKQFLSSESPISEEGAICSMRNPYKKGFIDEIDEEFKFINSNQVGSLEDSGAWMKTLSEGEGKLYEGDDCYALMFKDEDNSNKVLCIRELESYNNEWSARFISLDDCCEYTETVDFTGKPKEFELEFEGKPVEFELMEKDEDGNLVAEGNLISKGAWNGVYFSGEVVEEIEKSELENMSLDVGMSHDDKIEDAGEILSIEWDDSDIAWKMKFKITEQEAIELMENMETPGLSIETRLMVDKERRIVEGVKSISSVVVVPNPACQVCYIE